MTRKPEDLPAPTLHAFAAEEVGEMVRVDPRGRRARWVFLWLITLAMVVSGPPWHLVAAQVPEPPPPEPPTFELPEVIVPGRRPQPVTSTPASVSVLTRQDLERLGVLTVAEALQYVVEVQIRTQGGLGAVSLPTIRGSSPNQVLVLLDGVPINSAMFGLVDLSTVSAAQVERIEVLRGPFSALYGSGALGGVINIITAAEAERGLSVRAGGLSTTGVDGRWGGVGSTASAVSASRFSSAGFRTNSDVTSTTVAGRTIFSPREDEKVVLGVTYFAGDLGVPGSTAAPSPQARQSEARTIVSGRWDRTAGPVDWMVQGYGWFDHLRFVDPLSPPSGFEELTDTQTYGASVQRVQHLAGGRLQTLGGEWQFQALQDSGPVGSRQASVGALYLQEDRPLRNHAVLSAGLRYDIHSTYGSQIDPRVGVVYLLTDRLTLRAAMGRTFRGPTFADLYFAPCNNASLKPESAWSEDVSLTWRTSNDAEVRASVFASQATDLIRLDAMCIPQNIGHATITGGSLEVAGRLSPPLNAVVNVTATRAVDDSTGEQLLRVPWFSASAALHLDVVGGTVSVLATYVGSRPDGDPATFTRVVMPGYVVTALRLTFGPPETGRWQLGVDNLADVQYEPIAGFPAPGRTAFVAFTQRF